MSRPTTQANIIGTLLAAGYTTSAPACGDCAYASDAPQGTFCQHHLVLVDDNARCLHWTPAEHWLKANPLVAGRYTPQSLSPAELPYAHKSHTLPPQASKDMPWPFPVAGG